MSFRTTGSWRIHGTDESVGKDKIICCKVMFMMDQNHKKKL